MKHHKKFSFAHLTKQIGHELQTGSKEVFHLGAKVIQEPSKMVETGLNKAGNVVQGLELPILLIVGVGLFVYIQNKK